MVAFGDSPLGPVIITNRVHGTVPDPMPTPTAMAFGLADALARVHALDGTGLGPAPTAPPPGTSDLARRVRDDWRRLSRGQRVLTHGDFWCGNTLWQRDTLSGVIDWNSASSAPRGLDVAWCRLDLVLLGCWDVARDFLLEYERRSGYPVDDVAGWDRYAAVHADPNVESWSANYAGIGRPDLSGPVLRRRFDDWARTLSGPP